MQTFRAATVYGRGSLGGKGAGLVRVNECGLPRAAILPTHVLTTDSFDRYVDRGRSLGDDDVAIAA